VTRSEPLDLFHEPVRRWFAEALGAPTRVQREGFGPIVAGRSALLLAPTGSGKTLAAFLAALDRLAFREEPPKRERLSVIYVSPLKALAADVEKNLRAPVAGIAQVAARLGVPYRVAEIAVRTGDTPQNERAAFARAPADILITTPESLYLLLTSAARERLASVDTVIVDEIHSLAPSKRGAHLFLSLERLEALRSGRPPLQRIGLSATQRPLDEIARLLGGGELDGDRWRARPVEIVDAGSGKSLELTVEVPIEDMARLSDPAPLGAAPALRQSIWPSIHPRLVELVRAHRSTMIFVNSRRLAERLAGALNETAGEVIALAHHGSVAKEQRKEIEDRLKSGALPAIVATSSLELGIDMGAVDLVVQIEAPPSVASGIQRIGRAGHHVGAPSKGIVVPKYRGDLLASAAVVARMLAADVEPTSYPRNPLDVLAQQLVAMAAMDETEVDAAFELVRRAAPFAELPRASFEGVLDMLSGRYPSDEFAELRPRITWDRLAGKIRARRGARRLAVVNGGTIPDRGLYGVFLSGAEKPVRVGELDEEMVFESRPGDVFVLGASSWRIQEITHDRVEVVPAPGEPGRMPFWHGDRPGRSPALGRAVGALTREIAALEPAAGAEKLGKEHALDPRAAKNLVAYVKEELAAAGTVPSDRTLVIERFVDEVGDWRVCLLSPFGARLHAPLSLAMAARFRASQSEEVESLWSDDGIVLRFPESDAPPDVAALIPAPDEIEELVVRSLGGSALFSARFRENAARALLLPRRRPGRRSPLWAQRKRAADLLAVAARYGSFPILLETYRECLRDVFDLPALVELCAQVRSRKIRLVTVDTQRASPFAASLLFSYVASYIYDGDAPLAERRAQALSLDHTQLRELLGESELRELIDRDALGELERSLARLEGRLASHPDAIHDLLLALGPMSESELELRSEPGAPLSSFLESLRRERRVLDATIAGERRVAAIEDAARLRDALGVVPPLGVPSAFLESVAEPLGDLVSRFARTHGPFSTETVAAHFGIGVAPVRAALERLAAAGRVTSGELLPGGHGREWCDVEVLRSLKRRSLAKLRSEIEPVEPEVYARFLGEWHSLGYARIGPDALAGVLEQLQGAPLVASALEREILPARLAGYGPADLDRLSASGALVWRGLEALGPSDGRIALYFADQYQLLAPPVTPAEGELAAALRRALAERGASFFADLVKQAGAFARDVLDALWDMVWAGELTNDTLAPLRALASDDPKRDRSPRHRSAMAHRQGPPGSEGRWSLLPALDDRPGDTERRVALAQALLERHGVLTREAVHAENVAGGFGAVYPVLKAMEEKGRVRRGYFVAGLGATQFSRPGAEDRLRALRVPPEKQRALVLAATDPANPYGAALSWPELPEGIGRPGRAAGAQVVLVDGALSAWLARGESRLVTFLPLDEPERSARLGAVAAALSDTVGRAGRRALLISEIDGEDAARSPLAERFCAAGFVSTDRGLFFRVGGPPRVRRGAQAVAVDDA
jgi:ATP-dependent helicase Lhr and Lhr-like helicase